MVRLGKIGLPLEEPVLDLGREGFCELPAGVVIGQRLFRVEVTRRTYSPCARAPGHRSVSTVMSFPMGMSD